NFGCRDPENQAMARALADAPDLLPVAEMIEHSPLRDGEFHGRNYPAPRPDFDQTKVVRQSREPDRSNAGAPPVMPSNPLLHALPVEHPETYDSMPAGDAAPHPRSDRREDEMNATKVPDGGILYDEAEGDEDDSLPVEADATRLSGIDWNEAPKNESGLKGADLIAEFVKHLPNAPGVYRMFNETGDVMYVGKARSLKKRVGNYAQGRLHSNRLTRMVRETTHMEFVTTRTTTEAP